MAKGCDCTMEETGLPVLLPVDYTYCPFCGKELVVVNIFDSYEETNLKEGY